VSTEGHWWPWQIAIHGYTAPLAVLAASNWSSRADYIYRLTGDKELSDHIGRRIYAKMYPSLACKR
jgi:hypothetical protein